MRKGLGFCEGTEICYWQSDWQPTIADELIATQENGKWQMANAKENINTKECK
jgi:hypothetical protein